MTDMERRWFWWPRERLTYPWRPFMLGGNEYARRTLGVRLPGGMLFVCLWRFRGWEGPCARCGQWEPEEEWVDGPHCRACFHEIEDWANGCVCPSYLEATSVDDWLDPDCPIHALRLQNGVRSLDDELA